jgi:hypothetical protein
MAGRSFSVGRFYSPIAALDKACMFFGKVVLHSNDWSLGVAPLSIIAMV